VDEAQLGHDGWNDPHAGGEAERLDVLRIVRVHHGHLQAAALHR
jgi:hypothetical protein